MAAIYTADPARERNFGQWEQADAEGTCSSGTSEEEPRHVLDDGWWVLKGITCFPPVIASEFIYPPYSRSCRKGTHGGD